MTRVRNILVIAMASLALAACTTTGGGINIPIPVPVPSPVVVNPVTPQPNVNATVERIQNVVASTCKFLPAADTVLAILGTFNSGAANLSNVSAIAKNICAAINPSRTVSSGRLRGAGPVVAGQLNGVPIRGNFIR